MKPYGFEIECQEQHSRPDHPVVAARQMTAAAREAEVMAWQIAEELYQDNVFWSRLCVTVVGILGFMVGVSLAVARVARLL